MIRITYGDREYTIQPDDNATAPVRMGTKEPGTWVTVVNTAGFKIEVLSGGTKQVQAREASVAVADGGKQ